MDDTVRACLATESMDALAALDFKTSPSTFMNQMFGYTLLAAFANPARYAFEFKLMRAIRRLGTPDLLLQTATPLDRRPMGTALYAAISGLYRGQSLPIDVLDRGTIFVE